MTNENKDKIIDRVIDFLHNKPLKSDMRIAEALIEELKLVKNCSIPAVVGRSEQLRAFKQFLQSEYHLPVSNRMVDEFEQKQSS